MSKDLNDAIDVLLGIPGELLQVLVLIVGILLAPVRILLALFLPSDGGTI